MYRFQRTAQARSGKGAEAIQWAKKISEYLNKKFAPLSNQAYTEVFGDYFKVHWYTDFEDLAAYEKITVQLLTDQEYWAMLNEGAALFIEGATRDTLIQSL
jgi:Family of unknown function (DUF6039)